MNEQSTNYLNALNAILETGVDLKDVTVSRLHKAAKSIGRYETCRKWFDAHKNEIGANPDLPVPEWYQNITTQIAEQLALQAAKSWKHIATQIQDAVDSGLRTAHEEVEQFRSELAAALSIVSDQKISYRNLEVDLKGLEQEKVLQKDKIGMLETQILNLTKEGVRLAESNSLATDLNEDLEIRIKDQSIEHQNALTELTNQHKGQIQNLENENIDQVATHEIEVRELVKQQTDTEQLLKQSEVRLSEENKKVIALQSVCEDVDNYKSANLALTNKVEKYENQLLMLTSQIGELSTKQTQSMERLIQAGNSEAELNIQIGILKEKLKLKGKSKSKPSR